MTFIARAPDGRLPAPHRFIGTAVRDLEPVEVAQEPRLGGVGPPGALLGVAHQLRDVLAQLGERCALGRERRVALARAPLEEPADAGDRPTVEDGRGDEQRVRYQRFSSPRGSPKWSLSGAFRRSIACEWSCETRDSVNPSTAPTSFMVSSSW